MHLGLRRLHLAYLRFFAVQILGERNPRSDSATAPSLAHVQIGMLVFTVLAAVASLERSILVERIRMGLDNAKRRGVQLGRPPIRKLGSQEIAQVRKERLKGATLRQLAKAHRSSLWSIHKLCSR